jgi:ABC-type transporter Mla MlaB component
MLRITTDRSQRVHTLRLEGRLEGPWVAVLTQSWSNALRQLRGRRLCVDLSGVMFLDAAAKARLAEIYAKGAELRGDDLEIKAIIADIQTGRVGNDDGESQQAPAREAAGANISEQLTQLERLRVELRQVNHELAESARPLERLSELNEQQRQLVADKIREGLARWESVTQEIQRVMKTGSANGQVAPKDIEGELR